MRLLTVLRDTGLPQTRLVAGCLYQTIWNRLTGRPRGTGIDDYDVIYFDPGDLSWEAEDRVIRAVDAVAPVGVGPLQVRNQARVHLWFEQHFGVPYPPLPSADAALLTYPITAQAIGVRLETDGRLDIAAPFGLDDLFALRLRPNPRFPNAETYRAKAARVRAIWPEVAVEDWA